MSKLPGMIAASNNYQFRGRKGRRTIEDKRKTILRGIRAFREEKTGATRLAEYDPAKKTYRARVLYGSQPLPIFNGRVIAEVSPDHYDEFWNAIESELENGHFDKAIEAVKFTFENKSKSA